MGRSPCSDENGLKKGPWTPEEDQKLVKYIQIHGHGCWRALPKHAGLNRCGKSCRLRWTNYLRPDIKRGKFSSEEEQTILNLHAILGNKWSTIATHLPGRTDNEIKNFWNTHLKKKLIQMGFDPMTHQPRTALFSNIPHLMALTNLRDIMAYHTHYNQKPFEEHAVRLEAEAVQIARARYLQCMLQSSNSCISLSNISDMEAIAMLELASSTRPCVFEEETVMCNSYNFDNSSCSLAFSSSNSISSQSPVSSLQNMQILTQFQALDNPIVNSENNLDSSFSGLFHQEENTLKLPPFPPLNSSEDENYVSTLLETSTNSRYVASSFWPDMVLEEPLLHEIV